MSRVVSAQADVPCERFYGPGALPLPSNKTLWEARSLDEWETEKAFNDASFPMTLFGEVIAARRRPTDPLMARRLDAWEAGSDKMGVLMNIAVDLID